MGRRVVLLQVASSVSVWQTRFPSVVWGTAFRLMFMFLPIYPFIPLMKLGLVCVDCGKKSFGKLAIIHLNNMFLSHVIESGEW